jgi:hypothetical protein
MGDGSGGHPGYQTPRIVLSISLVDMYRTLQPSRRVDPCSPYSLLLPTGCLGDPFFKFEAELQYYFLAPVIQVANSFSCLWPLAPLHRPFPTDSRPTRPCRQGLVRLSPYYMRLILTILIIGTPPHMAARALQPVPNCCR